MALSKKRRSVTVSPFTSSDAMMRYEVGNMQGVGARQRQEDSFVMVNSLDEQRYRTSGLMFAVCDGMGGMKDGKIASETAINSLRNSFNTMNKHGDIATQLKESVIRASDEVEKILGGDGGSTVVIGIIIGLLITPPLHNMVMKLLEVDTMVFLRKINIQSYIYASILTFAFAVIMQMITYYKIKDIDTRSPLKTIE